MENRKQFLIIGAALIAGVMAVFFASTYVKNSIQSQTAALAEQYDQKQKEQTAKIQQKSEQQLAVLYKELDRVKNEQKQEMQKQVAVLQAQSQEQMRMVQQQQQQTAQAKKVRKPSLAVKTPAGKRAVTVMINSLLAVGGLLNAGDFVDVIAELNLPSQLETKKTVTAMIFQGLQVLAVNTNLDDPGDYDQQQANSALKVTFAVDPQEAGLLAFAAKNGSLELALRSPDETQSQKVKASTWKTLADYVLQNQGYNIQDPDDENNGKTEDKKPNIQIYRAGREI